jgi:hypothetical protein
MRLICKPYICVFELMNTYYQLVFVCNLLHITRVTIYVPIFLFLRVSINPTFLRSNHKHFFKTQKQTLRKLKKSLKIMKQKIINLLRTFFFRFYEKTGCYPINEIQPIKNKLFDGLQFQCLFSQFK